MATLDEILAGMDEITYLTDDIQFEIDEDLRAVSIPSRGVIVGVTGDKNVNYVNFKMVRIYNGIDMSDFEIRINYVNANDETGLYFVDSSVISDDSILFSWLVDSDVVEYAGQIKFSVQMIKKEGDKILKAFNSSVNQLTVLEGLNVLDMPEPNALIDKISTIVLDTLAGTFFDEDVTIMLDGGDSGA